MSLSVTDKVTHRLPRPVKCDNCGGPRVHLQKRKFMGLRTYGAKWDLIWHCADCNALVGCHDGTDIPLGSMADTFTRAARSEAHGAFDALWKGGGWTRAEAYGWMEKMLGLPPERAHIGMLNMRQCEALIEAVANLAKLKQDKRHWQQNKRKRRR